MEQLKPLSREAVRHIDQRAIEEFGVPGIVLMENAGRGTAELMLQLDLPGPVGIVTGKGNNGGDGFVIARHLDNAGVDVRVFLLAAVDRLTGDAAINARIAQRSGIVMRTLGDDLEPVHFGAELRSCRTIVDAMLGTGTRGRIREPIAGAITLVNQIAAESRATILAVDLPSGLDCDTGLAMGPCISARHTATFVAPKLGFSHSGASESTGQVHVIGIGAPRRLLETHGNAAGLRGSGNG